MAKQNSILKFLVTRKGIICTFIMTLAGYLGSKGYIGENEVLLIGSIVSIVTGKASLTQFKTGKN